MVAVSRRAMVTIKGMKPLMKRLKILPDRLRRAAIRPALTKAATPIVKAARRLAPVGAGMKPGGAPREHLKKTIAKTGAKIGRKTGNLVVVIGPKKKTAPHSHFVHEGTEPHEITIGAGLQLDNTFLPPGFVIQHPGAQQNPFLTNAIEATRIQSMGIFRTELRKNIEKQVQKLAKQK